MKALKEFALAASLLCAFAVVGCRNTGTHTDTGLGFDDNLFERWRQQVLWI